MKALRLQRKLGKAEACMRTQGKGRRNKGRHRGEYTEGYTGRGVQKRGQRMWNGAHRRCHRDVMTGRTEKEVSTHGAECRGEQGGRQAAS
jgi:hypothetical protein